MQIHDQDVLFCNCRQDRAIGIGIPPLQRPHGILVFRFHERQYVIRIRTQIDPILLPSLMKRIDGIVMHFLRSRHLFEKPIILRAKCIKQITFRKEQGRSVKATPQPLRENAFSRKPFRKIIGHGAAPTGQNTAHSKVRKLLIDLTGKLPLLFQPFFRNTAFKGRQVHHPLPWKIIGCRDVCQSLLSRIAEFFQKLYPNTLCSDRI